MSTEGAPDGDLVWCTSSLTFEVDCLGKAGFLTLRAFSCRVLAALCVGVIALLLPVKVKLVSVNAGVAGTEGEEDPGGKL